MCEESTMYYAEAIVISRYGGSRRRALLDDPKVAEFLRSRDLSPWQAVKGIFRALAAPTGETV